MFKQASTLSSLIALAIRSVPHHSALRVDINNPSIFTGRSVVPETASIEFSPRYQPHATNSPMPWRVAIESVILEMKRQLLDPAGTQLYVENRSSALWPRIEAPTTVFDTNP